MKQQNGFVFLSRGNPDLRPDRCVNNEDPRCRVARWTLGYVSSDPAMFKGRA